MTKYIYLFILTSILVGCDRRAKIDHIQEIVGFRQGTDTLLLYLTLADNKDSLVSANGQYYYYLLGGESHHPSRYYRRLYGDDKRVKKADFGMYALKGKYPDEKTLALPLGILTAKDFERWPDYDVKKGLPLALPSMQISISFFPQEGGELKQDTQLDLSNQITPFGQNAKRRRL